MNSSHSPKIRVLMIGASARELMQMAYSENIACCGIDLFADRDSSCCGPIVSVNDFDEVISAISSFDIDFEQVILTGGIENHSEAIRELDHDKIAGCDLECFERINQVGALMQLIKNIGIRVPSWSSTSDVDLNERWLLKPIRGSGGLRVRKWCHPETIPVDFFLQQFVPGIPMSATYFVDGNELVLVGVTNQLAGTPELVDTPFAYCGSIGPVSISKEVQRQLLILGEALTSEFNLSCFFGVDFLLREQNIWFIELNPRITASTEIHRRCNDIQVIESQLTGHLIRKSSNQQTERFHGKGILFNTSRERIKISNSFSDWAFETRQLAGVRFGDIPFTGTVIEPHHPIMTVYSSAAGLDQVHPTLLKLVESIRQEIKNRCPTNSRTAT